MESQKGPVLRAMEFAVPVSSVLLSYCSELIILGFLNAYQIVLTSTMMLMTMHQASWFSMKCWLTISH